MYKKGYYRGIPIIINLNGLHEIYGRNWFYEILVNINFWWDFEILKLEELPIRIEEDE